MTTTYSAAKGVSLEHLHEAMLDAFSDYDVPMQPDFEQFKNMLISRQFAADLSTVLTVNAGAKLHHLPE